MPWRNGAGTTIELLRHPEGEGRFLFRVSVADVSRDGPFSRFEGYDRHIVVAQGEGMKLDCGEHGVIALPALASRTFSGDWDVEGTLTSGPVRDYNLIVDRAWARSELEVVTVSAAQEVDVAPGELCVVHVLRGALSDAATGDTLVADTTFVLSPVGSASLAIGRIRPRKFG